ncbi:MAG: hypothetical protein ABFR62_07890 [Bacteroidota bacterium]
MKKTILGLGFISLFLIFSFQNNSKTDDSNLIALEKAKLTGDETITTPYDEVKIEHNFITDG